MPDKGTVQHLGTTHICLFSEFIIVHACTVIMKLQIEDRLLAYYKNWNQEEQEAKCVCAIF